MKTWLERVAETIPLPVYEQIIRREVVGFLYHMVSDEHLPHVHHLYNYKNQAMFQRDLAYLKSHYRLISYSQFLERQVGSQRDAQPMALLSFDDGFTECFTVIRPLLLAQQIPGMFFINTDGIDNRNMLYRQKISLCIDRFLSASKIWQQNALNRLNAVFHQPFNSLPAFVRWSKSLNYHEREKVDVLCRVLDVDIAAYLETHRPYLTGDEIGTLGQDGFTIGAHTRGHPKLNLLSPEEVEDEIAGSCRAIQELTGQEQIPFAFPFSAYGLQREMLAGILTRHPYIGMLFDAKGIRKDRSFIFNRIMADQPLGGSRHASDLPQHLHRSYQDVFLLKVRRRGIQSGLSPLTNLDVEL